MKTLLKRIGDKFYENFDNVNSLDLILYSATVNMLQKKRHLIINNCVVCKKCKVKG